MSAFFRSVATNDAAPPMSCPAPAGVQPGDYLLAFAGGQSNAGAPTIDVPAGWTQIEQQVWLNNPSGRWVSLAFFKRVATDAEPASYAFTSALAAHIRVAILAYARVDTSAVSSWATAIVNQTTSPETAAITTQVDNTLLVAAVIDGGAGTITAEASWTQRASLSSFAVGERLVGPVADVDETVWPDNAGLAPCIGLTVPLAPSPNVIGRAWAVDKRTRTATAVDK